MNIQQRTLDVAPAAHRKACRALIAELGDDKAAKAIGINRTTLLRAASGLPVSAGTRALLREHFDGKAA